MTISIYGHVTVEQIREKNKVKKKNSYGLFFIIVVIADYIILLDTICNRIWRQVWLSSILYISFFPNKTILLKRCQNQQCDWLCLLL